MKIVKLSPGRVRIRRSSSSVFLIDMKRGPPIRKSWDALQLRDQPDPPDPPSSFGHQALWEEIPSTPMPGINGVSAHGLIVMLASLIML